MNVAELQQKFLASNKEQVAPEDFFILLGHATKKEKAFLLTHPEYDLDTHSEDLARGFFRRRLEHEPVASIVGHKEFFGYDFRVTEHTLIPRPATELIVELALKKVTSNITIIDIGTGSGNIIISLAEEIKKRDQISGIRYYASDISEEALTIAKENAKSHQVNRSIAFLNGSLLAPYIEKYSLLGTRTIIVANLPYLSHDIYATIAEDVRDYEPASALQSDREGLDHYYRLLEEVKNIISKLSSITLFLEISPEQALPITGFISSLFPNAEIRVYKDLAERERVVEIHIER